MAARSYPSKAKSASVNENGININDKTYMKREIYSLEYKEPKGLIGAIFSSNPIAMVFLVTIPFIIMRINTFRNYWILNIVLKNEFDTQGNRKVISYYLTEDQVSKIKQNY